MKKAAKKITAVICATVIVASAAVISIFSISATSNSNTTDNTHSVENYSEEIAEIDKQYENQRLQRDENDLLTYSILRKYKKTDATELIQDKKTDCDLMREICKMIEENNLPDDEVQVLKNYLERRVGEIDDPNTPVIDGQEELKLKIEKDILGWDVLY